MKNNRKKCDVIIAFAFSKQGPAHTWLASIASLLSLKDDLPIFTQADISRLCTTDIIWIATENNGQYLSTWQIIQEFSLVAKRQNWQTVKLLAAAPHIKRRRRDLVKAGFTVVVNKFNIQGFNCYSNDDPQIWTRHPWLWWPREIALRLLPWPVYAKISQ